jgi:hypothetical protein
MQRVNRDSPFAIRDSLEKPSQQRTANSETRVPGVNYPWLNYGGDFGLNIWGIHAGVNAHSDEVRRDFGAMASIGLEVVRWFVFTDGRGGVAWDAQGDVAGLAPGFFDDMDAALAIARDAGLGLCLVLFDYSWMLRREERDEAGALLFRTRPDLLTIPSDLNRLLAAIVDPLLDRYGTGGEQQVLGEAIHSIDVMNEPDWVTRDLAPDRSRDAAGERRLADPFSRSTLRAFVGAVAARVHDRTRALVTLGGGRVRFASEWDHPAYGLDFIQLHSYPDIHHPRRDKTLFGRRCDRLALSKPVLIGECPANGDRQHPPDHVPPPFSLADYVSLARDGGYMGVWPWSFRGVDDFGAVDADAFRRSLAGDEIETRRSSQTE